MHRMKTRESGQGLFKYFAALIGVLTLAVTYACPAFAYDMPTQLRIGLESKYKDVDAIPISNAAVAFGYSSGGVFRQGGQFTSTAGFSLVPAYSYFVQAAQETSMEQAAATTASYIAAGYQAAPAYVADGSWTVYLCFSSESEARNAGAGSYLGASARAVALSDGGRIAAIFNNPNAFPQFGPAGQAFFEIGGRAYRGYVEACRHTGGRLTAVNVVSMEEYLYGVVPSEMPVSWSTEALKAQAVACRSYTASRMGVHSDEGYGLCDSIHCQSYQGAGNEDAVSTQAVQQTEGLVIYHNDQPINAVYFSSSGGSTEKAGNVWFEDVPYLQSVPEVNEVNAKQWERRFTLAELTALAAQNGANIGSVTGVTIIDDPVSGRVAELVIHGTNGQKSFFKEATRTFFSGSGGGSLDSRNYTLRDGAAQDSNRRVYVTDGNPAIAMDMGGLYGMPVDGVPVLLRSFSAMDKNTQTTLSGVATKMTVSDSDIVIVGSGWGHGVGMSQYGAEGMARMGYTWQQILEYYYTGVSIR